MVRYAEQQQEQIEKNIRKKVPMSKGSAPMLGVNEGNLLQGILRDPGKNMAPGGQPPIASPSELGLDLRQTPNITPSTESRPGFWEAVGHGAGQGFFRLGDEIQGAYGVVKDYYNPDAKKENIWSQSEPTFDLSGLIYDAVSNPDKVGGIYEREKELARNRMKQVYEERPHAYMMGQIPTAIGTYMATGPVAATALHTMGASEKDLLEDPVGLAVDTAAGAAAGKFGKFLGNQLGNLSSKTVNKLADPGTAETMVKWGVPLASAAYGYRQGGIEKALEYGAYGKIATMGDMTKSPVSKEMVKKVPTAANWLLDKFTPLSKPGLQFAIMEVFPSYLPNMSILRDVQDRNSVSNIIMNNTKLDSEQKALRVERIMKDGSFRYDDLPDDWYIQRGVQPEVQDMPMTRPMENM